MREDKEALKLTYWFWKVNNKKSKILWRKKWLIKKIVVKVELKYQKKGVKIWVWASWSTIWTEKKKLDNRKTSIRK